MGEHKEIGSSAADAKARGLKRYFTGKPCVNGNVAPRYLSGGCLCSACAEVRRHRAKAWWNDPANEGAIEAKRAKDKVHPKAKEWRQRHSARHAKQISAKAMEWQRANPERAAEIRQRWADNNPEALKAARLRRVLAVRQATPPWWSKWDRFVIAQAKELARLRTQMTGIVWEIDHMIPIQGDEASGLHCAANVQVIPKVLNQWKRGRLVLTERGEWIKHT
jgi:hypothetical protein